MEKNRLEKVRKHVFYKHTNIVTKKWGEKNARKIFFQKTHVYREIKTMDKNRLEKCENTFFYENTNIVTKKWGGKTREIFSRNTRISRVLNNGKKSSGKSAKTRFL